MRLGAMGAGAAEGDVPAVGRGELRALDDGDLIDREPRHVVKAVNRIAGEKVEQTLLHHPACPSPALLGRLEDEMDGAGKILGPGQVTRRAQQHRRMTVVTAGVHLARHRGFVGAVRRFRHGQRIHVGAQADGPCPVANLKRADDTGPGQAAVNAYPRFLEMPGDDIARPDLLEPEFRMGMQIAAQCREEGQIVGNQLGNVHRSGGTFRDPGSAGSAFGATPPEISDKSQNMNCLGRQPGKGQNLNATP